MDINDLKKVWSQYSSAEGKELDKETIREMLRGRTKSLIEKIERNIRIGFFIILALIVLFVADDFIISPFILNGISEELNVPGWVLFLDIFTNIVIIATFIVFTIKYYQVKKECDVVCNLPGTLKKIIHILKLYHRMFYYVIFILLISTATGFIAGLFKGMEYSAQISGIPSDQIQPIQVVITILVGLVVLGLISLGLFFLFRWGFNRLYGNYLKQLQVTLAELNEKIEDPEVI
jgi:hypothetical protein